MVTNTDFLLPAADRYPLAARLWSESDEPLQAVVINPGAGIAMNYYDRFASFLAAKGIPTLIYDYRGVGRSRPRSLRGFTASVEDWGSKDCAAALEWLAARFPGALRTVIGHSVGGLVTGFVGNGPLIDRMILVGAHTGYWRDYAPRAQPALYLLWHVLMPLFTRLFGYFPGRMLHLLEDLPAGVALEWAGRRRPELWWNRNAPDGEVDDRWKEEALKRFRAIRAPTLALRFSDDAYGTGLAMDRILGLYENCPATRLVFSPSDVGGQKIGHFGFFRSRFRDTLWERVLQWLRDETSTRSTVVSLIR